MAHISPELVAEIQNVAHRLRINSIKATDASKSGHPTSCSSMAEILAVLFTHTMKYEVAKPRGASNDRFVLSKGHSAPILYAAWAEMGLFREEELLNLRKIDSDLEGHPTPKLNFIDVATGSLGQGLSVAAGMAYTGKYLENASYRVYCILGDGETAEGSVWEALAFSSYYKLDNLVAIIDVNRLGQSQPTQLEHGIEIYRKRVEAFGFHPIVVDGHSVSDLIAAFKEAEGIKNKPTAILAKTFKGKFFPGISDVENWHGKPLGNKSSETLAYLSSLLTSSGPTKLTPQKPLAFIPEVVEERITLSEAPIYKPDEKVATRLAYGYAITKLGNSSSRVIALDGDTKNSTYADLFKKAHPERFIECFIAEQNLIGVAIGCGTRNRTVPFVSAFAAFFSRAFDQLRMGAISMTNINLAGSHAGISIGEDGPSQMALEDLSMFRSIPNSTVFYPSDAVSTERACELAANTKGVCFIRTSRPATAILYSSHQEFQVGVHHVLKHSPKDEVLVIGAGVTLHEALTAHETLAKENIHIRVLDLFTVKPINGNHIYELAKECNGRILTVEDHYIQGGIFSAVSEALNSVAPLSPTPTLVIKSLSVSNIPRSGPPAALLRMFKIDAQSIVEKVKELISN